MKRLAFLLLLFALPVFAGTSTPAKVPWFRSIDQAFAESRKTGKPVFVDAFADWCGWCHQLDKDVYSDPRFVKYIDRYVPLKVDVEDNGEGTHFAGKYGITNLPTLLVLNPAGELTNRIGGFMNTAPLVQDLDDIQKLVERVQKNPGDITAAYELADEYMTREMNSQAEKLFSRVLASTSASVSQKESSQFSIALAQYYLQNYDGALASLEKYEATYKNGQSDEDALLLLSEIHLERNATDKARYYLEEFLKKYPNSGNVNRAHQVLSTLESSN